MERRKERQLKKKKGKRHEWPAYPATHCMQASPVRDTNGVWEKHSECQRFLLFPLLHAPDKKRGRGSAKTQRENAMTGMEPSASCLVILPLRFETERMHALDKVNKATSHVSTCGGGVGPLQKSARHENKTRRSGKKCLRSEQTLQTATRTHGEIRRRSACGGR